MWSRFKTLDPWLYAIPLSLMLLSVLFMYTLGADNGSSLYLRQATFAALGVAVTLVMTFVDYRSLRGWWWWLYGAMLASLIAVPFFGKEEFGAQLWIDFGFFQFQPGELTKVLAVVGVTSVLSQVRSQLSAGRFFAALALGLIPIGIVALEDFGTALVLAASVVTLLLYASTARWQKILTLSGVAAVVLVIGLSLGNVTPFTNVLKSYQKNRLTSFLYPMRDRSSSGYNVLQSSIAVGSGGLMGKGLGFGSQSQLNFLPVAHTDFIFAVVAEAWGLVGAWGVIGLYTLLIYRILQAARIAKDRFGALICLAVAVKILTEVLVNIGMNIRLMPVTGIPLPFLSYGGTTMLTNALALGIVQSVVVRYKRLTF